MNYRRMYPLTRTTVSEITKQLSPSKQSLALTMVGMCECLSYRIANVFHVVNLVGYVSP